ncbi:MAG: YfhO family protein [Candidatus Binatia bacterium]
MYSKTLASGSVVREHWPLLAALCILLVYDAPLLAMRGICLRLDGALMFYPAEYALARALGSGSLPFWTPDLQAGFPLFADGQPGALYPINLLAFGLLPTPLAHNVILVLHHCLGLLFTFWWGRTLERSRLASAWMALLFSLTELAGGWNIPFIEALTWMPLLLALAERFARGARWAAWAAVPIAGIQWLAGFPQIAFYTVLACGLYVCMRVWVEALTWPKRLHLVLAWSGAAVMGILLAAPQLLATFELSRYSIRAGGIQGSLAGQKSLFPGGLLELIVPSWGKFFQKAGFSEGFYIGLLPGLIAVVTIIALARRASRQQVPWFSPLLMVIVVTTILAFGRFSPLFPIIRRLPGFAYFRIPSRFLRFTQFGLITFFGLGWDIISSAPPPRLAKTMRRLLTASAALLLLNVGVGYPLLRRFRPQLVGFAERFTQRHILRDPYYVHPPSFYQAKIAKLYGLVLNAVSLHRMEVWVPLTVAVAAWLSWRWSYPDARRQGWRQALWGVLILADVLAFAGGLHRIDDLSWVTSEPPTARHLQREPGAQRCRLFSVMDERAAISWKDSLALLPANYSLIAGLSSTGLFSPLGFQAYYRLMERLGSVNLAFGLRPVRPDDVARDRTLLDFLNVCDVLSRQPLTDFNLVTQVGDVRIYRNPRAMPRAFAVDRVEVVSSADGALEWVKTHPEHLHDTAIVEEMLPSTPDAAAAATAVVAISDYQAAAVTVDVAAAGSVVLVLTDTYYPGWRARLDGNPTRIYRTHGLFRAVVIPPGPHQVRFEYVPTTFALGVVTSGITVLLLAWRGVAGMRRCRRGPMLTEQGRRGEQ